jgi:hypothetical protein
VDALQPCLSNTFQRITLVPVQGVERVTVDLDLRLLWEGATVSLNGMAVAEVKQEGFSTDSPFVRQMRATGVRSTRFSKYCVGVSMLYPEIKHNRFKPQLRMIAALTHRERAS